MQVEAPELQYVRYEVSGGFDGVEVGIKNAGGLFFGTIRNNRRVLGEFLQGLDELGISNRSASLHSVLMCSNEVDTECLDSMECQEVLRMPLLGEVHACTESEDFYSRVQQRLEFIGCGAENQIYLVNEEGVNLGRLQLGERVDISRLTMDVKPVSVVNLERGTEESVRREDVDFPW